MTSNISLYPHIVDTKNGQDISLDIFLQNIQNGKWQDDVLAVRAGKREKNTLPYVTISGKFSERKNDGLVTHSGFICVDVDDVEPNEIKSIICDDKFVHAVFTSVSGKGVAIIFKIHPERHSEAFAGLQEYLFNRYKIISDAKCKDLSRPRFISWDPGIYINAKADKFTQYVTKKPINQVPSVVFVQSDFDEIINDIIRRRIDLTSDYGTWFRIGFALADKFGENGRPYFHTVSQFYPEYTQELCNRQYNACVRGDRQGITIATFYYLAKQAGISIVSDKTKLISQAAYLAKKDKRTKEDTAKLLQDVEGITDTEDIVQQVFDNNIHIANSDNSVEALEIWLRQNHKFRRNAVTLKVECNGKDLTDEIENTIYINAKKIFKRLSFDILDRLINSEYTPEYHPLLDFFEKYKHRQPLGVVRQLFDTIESDTGLAEENLCADYKVYFGTKWLVGMISAAHGVHSPLMLVLSGSSQNTGKTEWLRRFLPSELRAYHGETRFENGKDDEILMAEKWLILDDEMSGKNREDYTRLKDLSSKQNFYLRAPYGRRNMNFIRYAVLCGTTNHTELLNDPTGNRRIIPINVLSINQEAYNKIDKIDVLMEAYHLYKSSFPWEMTRQDISILDRNTTEFRKDTTEFELVTKYFRKPGEGEHCDHLTATEIKVALEHNTSQKLNRNKLGTELKKIFGEPKSKREPMKVPVKKYSVIKLTTFSP